MSDKSTHRESVKYPKISASPKDYQKILNKDIFAPVCYCNYKKEEDMNRKIYQRNIPANKKKNIPDYRPSFKVCGEYRDLSDPSIKAGANLSNKVDVNESFTSNYNTNNKRSDNYDFDLVSDKYHALKNSDIGKLAPDYTLWNESNKRWAKEQHMMKSIEQDKTATIPNTDYLRDIDIDSHLRQGFLHSACPDKRYQPELCETITVDNAHILDSPYCENYKVHKFNDMTQDYCPNKSRVSKDTRKQYREHDLVDSEVLQFNYRNSHETCNTPLRQIDKLSQIKQPVLFQSKSDMLPKGLSTGPERTNHKYENIWNNITRRSGI